MVRADNQKEGIKRMADFRRLSDTVFASPQLFAEDLAEAKAAGVDMVVNNRPDDEEDGQPAGAEIEAAARMLGIDYRAVPVSGGGFGEPQVLAMAEALGKSGGKTLAYCRTGTRSTLLWALAQANGGADPEEITQAARQAGYDVSPVRQAMDMLAARAKAG